jgi:hypothetical protein
MKEFKSLPTVKREHAPLFHSIERHNWHIDRYGHCLYCDLGSKVEHSTLIKEDEEL